MVLILGGHYTPSITPNAEWGSESLNFIELINYPVIRFLFWGFYQATIHYHADVRTIFQKALQNDFDALLKLLSLDPVIINEPSIARIVNNYALEPESQKYNEIKLACRRELKLPSKKKVKKKLARYMRDKVLSSGERITYAQIYDLFNRAAQYHAQDRLAYDEDFSSEDDFIRAIKREPKFT